MPKGLNCDFSYELKLNLPEFHDNKKGQTLELLETGKAKNGKLFFFGVRFPTKSDHPVHNASNNFS